MDGDILDSLNKYEEDDQQSIMRTLKAVHKRGWNHGKHPFQFYITRISGRYAPFILAPAEGLPSREHKGSLRSLP